MTRYLAIIAIAACSSPASMPHTPAKPAPTELKDQSAEWSVELVDQLPGEQLEQLQIVWDNAPVIFATTEAGLARYALTEHGWDAAAAARAPEMRPQSAQVGDHFIQLAGARVFATHDDHAQVALAHAPDGAAHLVVFDDHRLLHLVHSPRTDDRTATITFACASLIEGQLGTHRVVDRVAAAKHARDCVAPLPDLEALDRACHASDRGACLLAGALTVPKLGVGPTRVDLRVTSSAHTAGGYHTSRDDSDHFNAITPLRRDRDASLAYFTAACTLGSPEACAEAAGLAGHDARTDRDACLAGAPLACAAAIDLSLGDHTLTHDDAVHIRAALVTVCDSPEPTAEACNALAFLDDYGFEHLPHRDATRAHLRACRAGSTASCVNLLLRAHLPTPDKDFDGAPILRAL